MSGTPPGPLPVRSGRHARMREGSVYDPGPAVPHESAERDPPVGAELDGERGGRADRDQHGAARDRRLLHQLEREPPADAEHRSREWQEPLAEGPAQDLVHRVVAADVLAGAEQLTAGGEEPGRVEAPGEREGRLSRAEQARQRRDDLERHGEVAVDPGRVHRDRLERALPADTAGGRRVERPLDPAEVGVGRLHLDDVRGEVLGRVGGDRLQALCQAEAERELLVVPGSAHRDGHRGAVDPDLERLLDREPVGLDRPVGQPPDGRAGVSCGGASTA